MPITGGRQLSNIAVLLREVFEPGFVEAMNRDVSLLKFFKRDSFPGKEIRWKIHYQGNSSASSYAETDNLPQAGAQAEINASVPYKLNWIAIQVTNFAVAATRGQGGFVDLLAYETREALEDLKNELNRQLMVQKRSLMVRPNTDMDGIGCIVDDGQVDSTVTGYAGISFSSNPWWKPYVLANGGQPRPLTIALLQRMRMELNKPPRNAQTDKILCAEVHLYQYGNLMASLRRFTPDQTLDAGYPSMAFDGIRITGIPTLPAGDMYFLQTRDWGYYVLQNFNTEEKFVNGDARYFVVTHYAQLVCRALHRQGRIADLITT